MAGAVSGSAFLSANMAETRKMNKKGEGAVAPNQSDNDKVTMANKQSPKANASADYGLCLRISSKKLWIA